MSTPAPARPKVPASRYLLFGLIAVFGCGIDLWTKHWAFQRLGFGHRPEKLWIVPEILSLETSLNEGALFGFGEGFVLFFAALSIVAAVAILYWLFIAGAARDLLLTLALACVMGGIFGNLYDRLGFPGLTWPDATRTGHEAGDPVYAVRDWIHVQYGRYHWPIFNIADSLLVSGAGLLIWQSLRQERRQAAELRAAEQEKQPA